MKKALIVVGKGLFGILMFPLLFALAFGLFISSGATFLVFVLNVFDLIPVSLKYLPGQFLNKGYSDVVLILFGVVLFILAYLSWYLLNRCISVFYKEAK